jgi:hypothetical protein
MKKTKETWIPASAGMTDDKKEKNTNMSKGKIIFFGIVIVVVIALAVWAGIVIAGMTGGSSANAASPYSAVYLTTGDVYFGKLGWFPSPHMSDVWYITRNQGQNGQTQLGLAPMKSIFWGPVGNINLNAQDIVFSTRLLNSSQVVQAIENPSSLPGAQGNGAGAPTSANGGTQPATPTASSTPGGK